METSLEFSRWKENPRGVGYRRWAIITTGMRHVLRIQHFRVLLFASGASGLLMASLAFAFSQSVATGGWLEALASNFGPRAEAIAKAVGAMVLLYPDVCIRGLYTIIFWLQSFSGLWLSLLGMTAILPQLVARDRASQALTIYLSRPLTSYDYLVGKLGIIVGVLFLTWTGPLVGGWLLSLLLAPGRDFIAFSIEPLGRALLFNGIGLLALASIALGVSAFNKTSRGTIMLWIGLWVIAGAVASFPHAPDFVRQVSFTYDLTQIRKEAFRLDTVLSDIADTLPLLSRNISDNLTRISQRSAATNTAGAAAGLAGLVALSCAVFFRKLRPE